MIYLMSRALRVERKVQCKLCEDFEKSISSKVSQDDSHIEDYRTLELKYGADQESVRKAFIAQCKKYHPDSGNPDADSEKFHKIEKAYRSLQTKFIRERWDVPDSIEKLDDNSSKNDVKEYDIRHTAPQHREYLSWDGLGSGTPSQRQQQYMQIRANQAAERVLDHKMRSLEPKGNDLTVEDQKRVNKTKTSFGMDRLVEDLIQESMARGEFQNLSGAGKPLRDQSFSPYVDFVTHKMNEIMIENGFTPEWITLGREIQEDIDAIRKTISEKSKQRNNTKIWREVLQGLEASEKALNKKIQLFNLVVPILNRQLVLFRLDEEIKKLSQPIETPTAQNTIESKNISSGTSGNLFTVFSYFFKNS